MRVITIRCSDELHAALKAEAHKHHLSLNQLAIVKLDAGVSLNEAAFADGGQASEKEEASNG